MLPGNRMLKTLYLQLTLASLALVSAAAPSSPTKREISDAHVASSSYASAFPLAVTGTLGSSVLSPYNYAGSLGNLYEDDEYNDAPGFYEYPQYAVAYGSHYVPHTADDVVDDVSGFLPLAGFGGYPYYYDGAGGFLGRPAYYYGRFLGYYH